MTTVTFTEWTREAIDILNGSETVVDTAFSRIYVLFRDDIDMKLDSIINAGNFGVWFLQSDKQQCFFPWSSIVCVELVPA